MLMICFYSLKFLDVVISSIARLCTINQSEDHILREITYGQFTHDDGSYIKHNRKLNMDVILCVFLSFIARSR